uniref:Uncharacterized protein n=1 Tax=viral metagenome TaxID=1070528 RepID=A0A6C0EYA5_9ZZZZ
MEITTTNVLLIFLGIILILCFILMLMDNKNSHMNNIENFDPVIDAIQSKLQSESPAELKKTISTLQQRLIDYGYAPDLNNYVKKTQLSPNDGKCIVATADDRDKFVAKSDVPSPGPRIDLSQYVKKSSIPPATVCPTAPQIDYSQYVKKSTLPPNEKCPPCIAPKVKVSAGLCRECPPAPSCPPPERCPEVKCPPQAPCPTQVPCVKCDEIRYIKVPTVITKTVIVDSKGSIISQKTDTATSTTSSTPTSTGVPTPTTTSYTPSIISNIFGQASASIPSTTFPTLSSIPNTTLAQTLDVNSGSRTAFCPTGDLNSEFKSYGIYGPE